MAKQAKKKSTKKKPAKRKPAKKKVLKAVVVYAQVVDNPYNFKKGNKFGVGNKGGRPSVLTQEIVDAAFEFPQWCIDNPILITHFVGNQKHVKQMIRLPTLVRFAGNMKVPSSTMKMWALYARDENRNKKIRELALEFATAISMLNDQQDTVLAELGVIGQLQPTITSSLIGARNRSRGEDEREDDPLSDEEPVHVMLPPIKPKGE